jgi:hypothetical protein
LFNNIILMAGYIPRHPVPMGPGDFELGLAIGGFAAGFWTGLGIANLVEKEAQKLDKCKGNGNTYRAGSGIIGAGTAIVAISYPLAGAAFCLTTFFATGGIIVAASAVIGIMGW